MRVGYCVGHPQAIAILEKIRLPYNLPSFSIATALTALQNRNFLLSSIPQTLSQRDSLIEALSSHTMLDIKASTTNFIYLRVRTNCDRPQDVVLNHLHQSLKQQGSLVRVLPSGIRITVGTPVENFRTIERMKIAISQLGH
jgi:histidinol-phosphate aminotransferase